MVIKTHPVVGKVKSANICKTFIEGAPPDAEGHVFYGVNESNVTEWRQIRARGEPWFYIDNSFFDSVRGLQFRVAKNRIQTYVGSKHSDGKRFTALGLEIKPWVIRPEGYSLVIEQSPSFMKCVADDPSWLKRMFEQLPRPVKIRRWSPEKLRQQSTLLKDFTGTKMLVTHSSAAAVTALLEGVPVGVSTMSAIAETPTGTSLEQRQRVLGVLADNQFTLEEIKEGKAWALLNKS